MSQIKLTILVHEAWLDRFPQVVESCRQAGLVVQQELVVIGVINGSIDESSVETLTRIEGVRAVEPERMNRGLSG